MNYLEKAKNELLTYYTPKEIIDKINMDVIIKNPPFKK